MLGMKEWCYCIFDGCGIFLIDAFVSVCAARIREKWTMARVVVMSNPAPAQGPVTPVLDAGRNCHKSSSASASVDVKDIGQSKG
jgi:hypothetical protein